MVKFLKLPVLFRQVIYLMNKASLSISLPPSSPHLFCQRSKHAVTPRFCSLICLSYGSVSCTLICTDASRAFALCKGAIADHHLHSFHNVPLGGCPNRAELQKSRESPCSPGSSGLWSSTVQAPTLLCYVFGELHNIPKKVLSIVNRCKGLEEKM